MSIPITRFVWATAFILLVGIWVSRSAHASCRIESLDLKLEASFSLDGAPMRIQVARNSPNSEENDVSRKMTAVVFAHGKCQAICDVTNFEQHKANPLSLELACRSVGLSPLKTTATLFWPEALGQKTLTLRFGTWLTGYQKAPLKVRFDALSKSRLYARSKT